jgi:hypothetical protein
MPQRDPHRTRLILAAARHIGGRGGRPRLSWPIVESWACACCLDCGMQGGRGAEELEKILYVSHRRGPGYIDVLEYFLVKHALALGEKLRAAEVIH